MNRQERISLAGQALQGILERDTGWTSKLVDEIFYKNVASHCVSLADSILEKIDKEDKILVPRKTLENLCNYLEKQGLWDKCGESYYQIKRLL